MIEVVSPQRLHDISPESPISQKGVHILVTGKEGEVPILLPGNRFGRAQLGQSCIWVCPEPRAVGIELV